MNKRSAALTVSAAVTSAVLVAACGSSSKTTTPPTTPAAAGGGSTSSTPAATDGGLASAQALSTSYLQNPTSIGITNPITKPIPKGKYIVVVGGPEGVTVEKNAAFAAAGKALGWKVKIIQEGATADAAAVTLTQAIALKPDMILISGTPLPLLKPQLAAAAAAKIPVLAETVTDPKTDSVFDASIDGNPQVENEAKEMATYVAANSNGKANVAVFNIPVYAVLTTYTDTFKSTLESLCSACKVTVVNEQVTDIGTKVPTSVVSTLQRDPSIGYAIFTIGDLTDGLATALQGAGLTNKVVLGGGAPTQQNLQDLKAGKVGVWNGFSGPILGWRDADMAARYFAGVSLDPGGDALVLPTQLLTKDNIGAASLDSSGYYQGIADYQSQFLKLWGVTS